MFTDDLSKPIVLALFIFFVQPTGCFLSQRGFLFRSVLFNCCSVARVKYVGHLSEEE